MKGFYSRVLNFASLIFAITIFLGYSIRASLVITPYPTLCTLMDELLNNNNTINNNSKKQAKHTSMQSKSSNLFPMLCNQFNWNYTIYNKVQLVQKKIDKKLKLTFHFKEQTTKIITSQHCGQCWPSYL